jgi:hypothetical protein
MIIARKIRTNRNDIKLRALHSLIKLKEDGYIELLKVALRECRFEDTQELRQLDERNYLFILYAEPCVRYETDNGLNLFKVKNIEDSKKTEKEFSYSTSALKAVISLILWDYLHEKRKYVSEYSARFSDKLKLVEIANNWQMLDEVSEPNHEPITAIEYAFDGLKFDAIEHSIKCGCSLPVYECDKFKAMKFEEALKLLRNDRDFREILYIYLFRYLPIHTCIPRPIVHLLQNYFTDIYRCRDYKDVKDELFVYYKYDYEKNILKYSDFTIRPLINPNGETTEVFGSLTPYRTSVETTIEFSTDNKNGLAIANMLFVNPFRFLVNVMCSFATIE